VLGPHARGGSENLVRGRPVILHFEKLLYFRIRWCRKEGGKRGKRKKKRKGRGGGKEREVVQVLFQSRRISDLPRTLPPRMRKKGKKEAGERKKKEKGRVKITARPRNRFFRPLA